jgi:hypothetical protein
VDGTAVGEAAGATNGGPDAPVDGSHSDRAEAERL